MHWSCGAMTIYSLLFVACCFSARSPLHFWPLRLTLFNAFSCGSSSVGKNHKGPILKVVKDNGHKYMSILHPDMSGEHVGKQLACQQCCCCEGVQILSVNTDTWSNIWLCKWSVTSCLFLSHQVPATSFSHRFIFVCVRSHLTCKHVSKCD